MVLKAWSGHDLWLADKRADRQTDSHAKANMNPRGEGDIIILVKMLNNSTVKTNILSGSVQGHLTSLVSDHFWELLYNFIVDRLYTRRFPLIQSNLESQLFPISSMCDCEYLAEYSSPVCMWLQHNLFLSFFLFSFFLSFNTVQWLWWGKDILFAAGGGRGRVFISCVSPLIFSLPSFSSVSLSFLSSSIFFIYYLLVSGRGNKMIRKDWHSSRNTTLKQCRLNFDPT